jgi:predicted GNAT family acetyltransferase
MTIDPKAISHQRTARGGRYAYRFEDGAEAVLDYVDQGEGVVAMTHTGTPPHHRNKGVAEAIVRLAVAEAREAGTKIIPVCSYVAALFARNPDWADLRADQR